MLLGLRQPEQAVARGGQEQCLDRLLVAGIQGFPGFADIGLPEGGHRGDVVGAGQANPVLLWRRIELLADPQQVAVGIDQGEFAHTQGWSSRAVMRGILAAQAEGRGLAMQRLGVLQAQVGSAAIGLRFERFEQRQVQLQGAALEDGVGRIASAKVEAEGLVEGAGAVQIAAGKVGIARSMATVLERMSFDLARRTVVLKALEILPTIPIWIRAGCRRRVPHQSTC